jgi:Reverse transcriptase (RNA-dependent DNA polymerase)
MALTAAALVRKGYFPRELPPPFTTGPLADLYDHQRGALLLTGRRTECARHNLARLSGFRRPLKVPNPESFTQLSEVIQAHWQEIERHLKSHNLALSRPVVTRTAERAARPRFRLGEATKLRPRLWRAQKYVLFTDVSQFYPSLYTHAIPWALHTKPVAKANIGNTTGDAIDKALRACSSGQTVGVPIGPDTSFVAAEIVMTAVDALLGQRVPAIRGFRYIDDYELAFKSRAEAEEAQVHVESALGDFELVANPFKTHIRELPQPFRATWAKDLSVSTIRTRSSAQTRTDLIDLFSRAAEVARANPWAGALKYALLVSRDAPVSTTLWPTFQALIWSAVTSEPTTAATALDLLTVKSAQAAAQVDRHGAGEVLETLIATHAPMRNASEVAWALWGSILLDIPLSASAATAITALEDDFVALLGLHAASLGRFPAGALNTTNWESLISYGDVLIGPHWLLAYEATVKGWLGSAAGYVAADPFFGVLQRSGVYFYDLHPIRSPFTGPAAPLPGGTVPESYL